MKKTVITITLLFIVIANKFHSPPINLLCDRPLTLQEFVLHTAPDSIATLVYAMVEVESNWNIYAHSSTGDHGLMQINHRWWSHRFDFNRIYEPEYNLNAGIAILTPLLEKHGTKQALRRYNGSMRYAYVVNNKHKELFNKYLFD